MTEKCVECLKTIDIANDAHYLCGEENRTLYYCENCGSFAGRCPGSGRKPEYVEESITKKSFFNPSTRNGLGF